MLNCGEENWELSSEVRTGIGMMKMGLELVKRQLILRVLKISSQITQNIWAFVLFLNPYTFFSWDGEIMGFPGDSVGKESAWNSGDTENMDLIPELGRFPGGDGMVA